MANAKKCDRCGALYEGSNKKDAVTVFNAMRRLCETGCGGIFSLDQIDLCPACRDSFEKWLEEGGGVIITP